MEVALILKQACVFKGDDHAGGGDSGLSLPAHGSNALADVQVFW